MRTAEQKLLNAVSRPEIYREVVVPSQDADIVLSVWEGAAAQPVVLFLPGTMTHPLFYEEFLTALAESGVTTVGLHAQGHGKSPRARRPLTFSTLVRNAVDAVTWCRDTYPDRALAVLGSSQGGIVAMALAARDHRIDAVFAHNILDPSLPSSIEITRFPAWLAPAYPLLLASFRIAARVAPNAQVPFDAYLDINRVCRDHSNAEFFYTDPLGLRSYPLVFMASLFTADLSGMRNGSITCPVTVVAGRGDPLFPLAYTEQVFAGIVARRKELLVIDSEVHLLFNEDTEAVLWPLLARLRALTREPTSTRSAS
jgi:alpha-beta hydrolase superfamily lysophospholipase